MGDPYTDPDFPTAALITIDMQRDVLDGEPLEVPGTSAAVGRARPDRGLPPGESPDRARRAPLPG